MIKGADLGVWREFIWTRSKSDGGWPNTPSRGLTTDQIRDVSLESEGGELAIYFTLNDGERYFAPLSKLNVVDARALHNFIESHARGTPTMGLLITDMWDYDTGGMIREEEEPSRESRFDYPLPSSSRREAAPAPAPTARRGDEKHWTEGKKSAFDWSGEPDKSKRDVGRVVKGWIRENPHNVVDILTGMFGLARNESQKSGVREALEAARGAGEGFPPRKKSSEIGRKMETYPPSEENFYAFKQALLDEVPALIKDLRKKEQHEQADHWVYLADKIQDLR